MKTQLRSLLILALWLAAAGAGRAQAVNVTLSLTFPPKPDYFGSTVAALGADKVVIGAPNFSSQPGTAYLFKTNGTLITTFTNPVPTTLDSFGSVVAAVGLDMVLIGAEGDDRNFLDSGAAYLFSTNGTLLTTYINPTPGQSDRFGTAVSGVGSDKVLIGASDDDTGGVNAGSAYLFSTNGTLLTTFTNPVPAAYDFFGSAVAAVGNNHLIIGAMFNDTSASNAGAVYLYNTAGALVRTFTNPLAVGGLGFGDAVAALGPDTILVGASANNFGATGAGAAYLFSTNGALITTFTNPTPAVSERFGRSVTAVGLDKVLFGALDDDTGAMNAGAAYLFSTNGTLLASIFNPLNPALSFRSEFGYTLAAVGSDKIVIGGVATGAAYLYSLSTPPGPRLNVAQLPGGNVRVSWPLPATGFVLEQSASLTTPPATNVWSQVPFPYSTNATQISVTVTPTTNQFYRLRQP